MGKSNIDTMLEIAAKTGSIAIFEKQLKNKSDININGRNSQGKTALILAAENGHYEIVRRLLRAGADYTCVDKFGMTAKDYLDKKTKKIVPNSQGIGISYIPVQIKELEDEPEVVMQNSDQQLLKLISYLNNAVGQAGSVDNDPDLGQINL